MFKPAWAISLDECYERIGIETLHLPEEMPTILQAGHYMHWLEMLHQRDFKNFFETGHHIIKGELSYDERIFVLSWLVIGTEVIYDLSSRHLLLETLKKAAHLDTGFFADSMVLYFEAVSHYFKSDLETAEVKFNQAIKLFEKNSDQRGIARCYFHLALIDKIRADYNNSKNHIKICLDICSRNHFYKTKNRALDLYLEITSNKAPQIKNFSDVFNSTSQVQDLVELIKSSLLQKDFYLTRLLIQKAEKLRKSQGYARGHFSLFFYLIQANFLQGTEYHSLAYLQLSSVKDSALYLQLIDWMKKNKIPLRVHEEKMKIKTEFLLRRIDLEQNLSEINLTTDHLETIHLRPKLSQDVSRLIEFLYSKKDACSKEEIFEYVYKIQYDPVIHDSKLYKLILKAKKLVAQDFVLNHYGEYSFNTQKYRLAK